MKDHQNETKKVGLYPARVLGKDSERFQVRVGHDLM